MGTLMTVVRRSLWIVLIAGAGGAVYARWRDREVATVPAAPVWPPLDVPVAATAEPADWVDPADDGSCPIAHPVKANANSGIFHVPGGRFYDRTKPERCYSTEDAAIADGYRRAKH